MGPQKSLTQVAFTKEPRKSNANIGKFATLTSRQKLFEDYGFF